jgi:hypothetical protein
VSKLRENAKTVIGVGVKNSTSDLLISNCDEFIYYDDLVRDSQSAQNREKKRAPKKPAKTAAKKTQPAKQEEKQEEKQDDDRSDAAIELVLDTAEDLASERGVGDKLWASMIKQTLKRRRPGFHESFYGFRSCDD